MAKKRDFPTPVRPFIDILNSFKGYWHDYDIFRDFITFSVGCFLFDGDKPAAKELRDRYKDDYPKFQQLLFSVFQIMHDQIGTNEKGWYDVFGGIYESIASGSHVSWLGQFFTPPHVVDFMTQITGVDLEIDSNGRVVHKTVNDPCSGSGRFLLSFHAHYPGNYLYAQDKDPICTKMTAVNMAIHGCVGQAVNGNSLIPGDFHFGYMINPLQFISPMPHLFPIRDYHESVMQLERFKIGLPAFDEMPKQQIPFTMSKKSDTYGLYERPGKEALLQYKGAAIPRKALPEHVE